MATEGENKLQRDESPPPHDLDAPSWESGAFKPPAPPPRFVPATLTRPEWGSDNNLANTFKRAEAPAHEVSNWYRSLTSKHSVNGSNVQSRLPSLPRHGQDLQTQSIERKDKNSWFIFNALRSNPEVQSTGKSNPSTLADIVARDPPPLPDQKRFKPPVWLEIGPSNKGFAMLQRSGWSEGEPLGPDVVRRQRFASDADIIDLGKGKEKSVFVKQEIMEVDLDGYDDVTELRQVDVIDLTTDGDDDPLPPAANAKDEARLQQTLSLPPRDDEDHGRTALLTPIATVLKSDRLGIGLKAKTVGPYKASRKRVTHNAAALAAHIKAAEESRRKRKLFGRGSRGFGTQQKRDESHRKHLLAYLND
ncbi:hypothetical protein C0992_012708 [Termitomyces sp. T32_za158]|nr:hypothetical protein C0992_012708 [Termitomyces sp. T32_za158]